MNHSGRWEDDDEEAHARFEHTPVCATDPHAEQDRLNRVYRNCRMRLMFGGVLFMMAFSVVAVRLVDVTILTPDQAGKTTAARHAKAPFERAEIVDRNGVVLATNLATASVYANPKHIKRPEEVVKKITRVLPDVNGEQLLARLKGGGSFLWIKRNLSPKEQYAVNSLGIPGVQFLREERRVYPYGNLFSHVLGYVSVDNQGMAGIEQSHNTDLREKAQRGEPLKLSVDARVQGVLREEMQHTVQQFSAVGAVGMVVDVTTGEIVAMSSLPDFDPHKPTGASDPNARFNRATLGAYEMGSTFKALTVAMALDSGKVRIGDSFDASAPIKYARFSITDYHAKNRALSVPEIFMYSSNIGTAKMALAIGGEAQREFLGRMGLLKTIDVGLPEKATPLTPKNWNDLSVMTVSFGHGIAVTPTHMMQAVSALVNGGKLRPLTLVQGVQAEAKQVISADTSYRMRQLLRLVVEKGTGGKGDVEGYLVGGKTGTSEKAGVGGYNKKSLISSFVAAFPINDPKYLVFVMVDEPKGTKETHGYATGGWTAAPAVSRIIARIGPMLGVKPVRNYANPNAGANEALTDEEVTGGVKLASFGADR